MNASGPVAQVHCPECGKLIVPQRTNVLKHLCTHPWLGIRERSVIGKRMLSPEPERCDQLVQEGPVLAH